MSAIISISGSWGTFVCRSESINRLSVSYLVVFKEEFVTPLQEVDFWVVQEWVALLVGLPVLTAQKAVSESENNRHMTDWLPESKYNRHMTDRLPESQNYRNMTGYLKVKMRTWLVTWKWIQQAHDWLITWKWKQQKTETWLVTWKWTQQAHDC